MTLLVVLCICVLIYMLLIFNNKSEFFSTTINHNPKILNFMNFIKTLDLKEDAKFYLGDTELGTETPKCGYPHTIANLDQCGESYSLANATNPKTAFKTCPLSTPKCYGHVSNKNWGVCVHSKFNNEGNGKCGEQYNPATLAGGNGWKTCPATAPKCVGHKSGTWGHCTHSNFDKSNRCAYNYQDKGWRTKYRGEMPFMCPISRPKCIGYKKGTWGTCGKY